eukprot:TRINITY_DN24649_c0_g1_i1.p2 TRINITY_DN24649_c0_g1~~TRINITY_DN24649_c0_g1_i1.p2  ORF type:complete len:304 (+),score=72.71 TRINITY_DN24649_c0_g1_i1:103-912(+)
MEASPIGQFLILAQSTRDKACEKLVHDVLEHSGIFVFGELLACPNVQALANSSEGSRFLALLRLFAFGTYADYKAQRADFLELTPQQLKKLRLLSVVTLATKEKYIKFDDLKEALDITATRELEDLIIEAVYQNLIVGKMDQEHQCLIVESCFCRDCQDEDLDYIIDTLSSWHESSQAMLGALDNMVQYTHDSYDKNKKAREELDKHIQSIKDNLKEGDGGVISSGGDGGGCTRMPTDDVDEESKRAKSTRGRCPGGVGQSSRAGSGKN